MARIHVPEYKFWHGAQPIIHITCNCEYMPDTKSMNRSFCIFHCKSAPHRITRWPIPEAYLERVLALYKCKGRSPRRGLVQAYFHMHTILGAAEVPVMPLAHHCGYSAKSNTPATVYAPGFNQFSSFPRPHFLRRLQSAGIYPPISRLWDRKQWDKQWDPKADKKPDQEAKPEPKAKKQKKYINSCKNPDKCK